MTTPRTMDVFALRDCVVTEYERFATSFTRIAAGDIRDQVEAIYAGKRYWPEPLIQINPAYKRTAAVADLVRGGLLDPDCAGIFDMTLYKHQEEAVALASTGESYVVTTGTGSGKSLCFFIPIVSAVLAEKRRSPKKQTRAIVIYPMNALANSQFEELAKYLPDRPGGRPVTFARYTGQESADEREAIANNPPDILLTNFMMLELLMTRQDDLDRRVIGNCEGLRFLVLDELHTYRGRQGADVAMLVRRVRERLARDLQCIGTSATMKSDGTIEERSRVVADVASKLFAARIPESNVIGETLERVTDPAQTKESVRPRLGEAIDAGIPATLSDAELHGHPLTIWVETQMGVTRSDEDPRWRRAQPLTLTEARQRLSEDSGRDVEACERALRQLLLVSSLPEKERVAGSGRQESFFAFKLHQFISGAGHAYATLEPPGQRRVTVEGQLFLPGDPEKRLYSTHFCRNCGQEYHPVRLANEDGRRMVLARNIDDAAPPDPDESLEPAADDEDGEEIGFLTVAPTDPGFTFTNDEEDYPETWRDHDSSGNARLKRSYRSARARSMRVEPDGRVGSGIAAWFSPGKFRFCLRCGDEHRGSARDRNRLASLSAEGRSSATTVLVSTVLRWMHGSDSGLAPYTRKLLGFTDNRQDAALQAGHFNDFLFVSLVRAGFLRALEVAGEAGIAADQVGVAQQRALGFDRIDPEVRAEWQLEPGLVGLNRQEAERTLREVLAYRAWFDQRRGWRYTNPNLEQLELLRVDYLGLEELAADDQRFVDGPAILAQATPTVRATVYRTLFDHLRTGMAIRSSVLDALSIEQLFDRSQSRLRTPWGFGRDEKPRPSRWLILSAPRRKDLQLKDEDLIVRGGARSALGRKLKSSSLWGTEAIRDLKSADFDDLLTKLLKVAAVHGLVTEESTAFDVPGWKLTDAAVVFKRGNLDQTAGPTSSNAFFGELYQSLSMMLANQDHPLFGFEAREHTAQVEQEKRQVREKRFRYGQKEQDDLADRSAEIRELGETGRFLPVLFCSPTMELGVDISTLNAVYLRNVPPTPANYAQRSGRAGRSGQAALVLTYASAQGPHDQYFFRDPGAMVHGEVQAPTLDLANRDLIDSHLHAVWLACTQTALAPSIADLLVLLDPVRPLRDEVRSPMAERQVGQEALTRMTQLLELVAGELSPQTAPWYTGPDSYARHVADHALASFDRALNRWRDLFCAAEQQRDSARRIMDDHSAPQQDKRAAKMRHDQAIDQINLLQQGDRKSASSDFYTYRYLATEGFLPGYNFPRLPLMAYIPKVDARGRQAYLQRPRFLALAEFGPGSLVYHEGRAFRVVRAMLSTPHQDQATASSGLATETVRVCRQCGAGHWAEVSVCHACHRPLGDADIVSSVYRIENVATWPAERITANDEERQRQGFELQTTFEWVIRDGAPDARRGVAQDSQGAIVNLAYGPGARITRLNKGLRRRANKREYGFWIDPITGRWKADPGEDGPGDPTVAPPQLIVPSVRDHKNALLVAATGDQTERSLTTLQHALLRGVEAVFQLEEGEVLAEPVPSRDARKGFLMYEATEGGAGVLTRLIAEPDALARVAHRALQLMHLDLPEGDSLPEEATGLCDVAAAQCVAGCYRCLLSYYNQPDHELIDRRDEPARTLLLRLARARTSGIDGSVGDRPDQGDDLPSDGAEGRWLAEARMRAIPAPDSEPLSVQGSAVPLCWRSYFVAALIGQADDAPSLALRDLGFEVIAFGERGQWPGAFDRLARALGHANA